MSYEAEAALINERFQRQLIGLRRRFQPWQIDEVLRSLRAQRDAEMFMMRERRATDAFRENKERRRERPLLLLPT